MATKAKAVTGTKAQAETVVQDGVKVTTVAKSYADMGFVDYAKSRNTILEGRFILLGVLAKGDEKVRHWILKSVDKDGKPGQCIAYLGNRKDGKGVYCRSEIKSICSEFKKAEAKEVVKA